MDDVECSGKRGGARSDGGNPEMSGIEEASLALLARLEIPFEGRPEQAIGRIWPLQSDLEFATGIVVQAYPLPWQRHNSIWATWMPRKTVDDAIRMAIQSEHQISRSPKHGSFAGN